VNDTGAWTERRDELLAHVLRRGRARKLRRRLAGAASVAVVAAVVVLGVVSATAKPTRSVRVLNPAGSTTTVPHDVNRPPAGVLLIGDSVMLGARHELERAIPGAFVDAKVSRQFWDAIPLLRSYRASGLRPQAVVIHLGNNGAFTEKQVAQVMQAAGAVSEVYFLTVHEPRPWAAEVNSTLGYQVQRWPNAHILDWRGFSDNKPWFTSDGIHLAGDGITQYAQFIRDGVRPGPTTFSDPFAGVAAPSTGLYVTDDSKWSKDAGATSFAVTLFGDDGQERGMVPRAAIGNDVLNVDRKQLVVTDAGIHLAAVPLDTVEGLPGGCTQTEAVRALAVALCGRSGGRNLLLGDRILVNRGSGWQPLIAKPPGAIVGHWDWASPSPDGQWVLAAWSAECEVVTSVFVRVADGAVHSVTGRPGIGGPESGELGWTAFGDALAVFGGDSACGGAASRPRGVYVVSPTEGIRRMLLPLGPAAGVIRWTSVDDQRTRRDVPVPVDLDGDGRVDQLSLTARANGFSGPIQMRATLADGRVLSGTYQNAYAVHVVGTADLAGDGRHEVLITVGGDTWTTGAIVLLDGDGLVTIGQTPDGSALGWDAHSNGNPNGTADVACHTADGKPSLVVARSTVETDGRHWQRWVYTLEGARLVLRNSDTGVISPGSPPLPDVPLANGIECG
jgi:hypothetical protein